MGDTSQLAARMIMKTFPRARMEKADVERNPVEAGLVSQSEDWPYSSSRHYELGQLDSLGSVKQ